MLGFLKIFHLQTFLCRLKGKPTLVLGSHSSISSEGRVYNIGLKSNQILVGSYCRIEGILLVFAHGGRIAIGDWCFVGQGSRIWSSSSITIGNRVLISHNCNVMDSLTHPFDPVERHAHFCEILTRGHPKVINLSEDPICIEDDVWIGANVTILKGVRIGRAAIVGAGSVVTKDILPFTVVAGNPARIIRSIPQS